MTTSFDALKKNRSKSLEALTDQLSKINSKGYNNSDDGKHWKCTRDSSGNGMAVIRFLPAPANEDVPFVRIWDHGFQGPGGWYIEKSLTTIGKEDPMSEINSKLWNSGIESDKELARKQKRRLQYVSNIYVVKDPGNPDNEGKVFLFSYGKKIFDKLNDLMNPSFEDEKPINPFDLWDGANFRLKIRQVEGYANYDKSDFDTPGPLFDEDEKLEAVWKQAHSLAELIDPKNFKTFEELQAKAYKALGINGGTSSPSKAKTVVEDDEDEDLDMSKLGAKSTPEPEQKAKEEKASSAKVDDDDDDLEYFRNLGKA